MKYINLLTQNILHSLNSHCSQYFTIFHEICFSERQITHRRKRAKFRYDWRCCTSSNSSTFHDCNRGIQPDF